MLMLDQTLPFFFSLTSDYFVHFSFPLIFPKGRTYSFHNEYQTIENPFPLDDQYFLLPRFASPFPDPKTFFRFEMSIEVIHLHQEALSP